VQIEVPRRPRRLTDCNCSICRRYGTRWAYYRSSEVRVIAARGATARYSWGERFLEFVRCATCGTVTHWQQRRRGTSERMGVNARNFDPAELGTVRVRRLDGAVTWKFLD
jgi:hypothetical protein